MTKLFGLLALAGIAVAMVFTEAVPALGQSDQNGQIHIIKDCSMYNLMPGGHCVIASSNIPQIPVGSLVYYAQAFGATQPGWIDSNVVLDTGNGNKAIGRCVVDFAITTPGVCAFSDGTGTLAGFTARVFVGTVPTPPADYTWDGTFSFKPLPGK